MISPQNYAALYDFSTIERAVQSYFCSFDSFVKPPDNSEDTRESWQAGTGNVAFFTPYELALFQKNRPRVIAQLSAINALTQPGHGIEDGNGALRNNIWKATLRLEITTENKYELHNALRSMVYALGEMIAPYVRDSSIKLGVNQYSDTFQLQQCINQNADTGLSATESGAIQSDILYTITFGLPEQAILAVV